MATATATQTVQAQGSKKMLWAGWIVSALLILVVYLQQCREIRQSPWHGGAVQQAPDSTPSSPLAWVFSN